MTGPCLRRLSAATFVVALLALTPLTASAAAQDLTFTGAFGTPGAPAGAGLIAATPSGHAIATVVSEGSGLEASRVTSEDVCSAPRPGHAACESQVIVLRSSHHLAHPLVQRDATYRVLTRRRHIDARLAPAAGTSSAAAALFAHTPAWLQQAYDLTYLSETNGAADTVAVVDVGDDPTAAADLATFRSYWGLPACTTADGCFTQVGQTGSATSLPSTASTGWREEESLDLDAVSSLCPNCHIDFVEANSDGMADLDAAVDEAHALGADQISASWAAGSSLPYGESFTGENVIASSGDSGYAGYDIAAWPAAMPGVTAAGGTTLTGSTTSATPRGYAETAWSLSNGQGGGSGCARSEAKPSWQTDTGCPGRAYADVSADANPSSGLDVYDSQAGGWLLMGGTSLSAPLIAAYEGVTGLDGASPQWAYSDSALLNDPVTGSTGTCTHDAAYICTATRGYDGPTGNGSIAGDVVTGGPGVGGPPTGSGTNNTYVRSTTGLTATLAGGVYPNGLDTTYSWQYGTSTAYGSQTPAVDAGAGSLPVAASATLTGLTPSTTYHYRLVASNADGTMYGYDYTLTTGGPNEVPPSNTAAPTIAGAVEQGVKLSASAGSWSPSGTSFGYQWQLSTDGGSGWSNISGATSSSYTVPGADLGDDLRVQVTATNAYGTAAATSATAGPVASGVPAVASAPVLTGTAQRGDVLSATAGSWTGAGLSFSYHWQRSAGGSSWTSISGATSSRYTPAQADEGNLLRVVVTTSNPYGSVSSASAATGTVRSSPPVDTSAPSISGTAARGDTLTGAHGTWGGSGTTLTGQWQRSANNGSSWTNIAGATGSTYKLAVADEGDKVRYQVTGSNADGRLTASSAASATVTATPPVNSSAPKISGTARHASTLTVSLGSWHGVGNAYSYRWQRSSDGGSSWTTISGATGSSRAVAAADEGFRLRVIVTATNADGSATASTSATAVVPS